MKRRLLSILLLVPVLLAALAVGAWTWLWHSTSGAEWLWHEARERLAASPRAARLEGRLSGTLARGVTLSGFVYRDADLTARAERLEFAATMTPYPAVLTVRRLKIDGVELEVTTDRDQSAGAVAPTRTAASDFGAPIRVIVKALTIEGAVIRREDMHVPIDAVRASGEWFEALSLEVSEFRAPAGAGVFDLQAGLATPFPLRSRVRIDRLELPEQLYAELPWLPDTLGLDLAIDGDADALALEGSLRWPEWLPEAAITGRIEQPLADPAWTLEATVPLAVIPEEALGDRLRAAAQGQGGALDLRDLALRASGDQRRFEFGGETRFSTPWTHAAKVAFEGAGDGGRMLRWLLEGQAELRAEGWPASRIDFTAGGTGETLSASVTAPELFGGSLSVSALTQPGEGRPWQAELTLQQVSAPALIAALSPHLEPDIGSQLEDIGDSVHAETLDALMRASGRLEPLQFSVDIERLRGRLRGREVTAAGRLEYGQGGITASGLAVESGASRLVFDGTLDGPPGLEVQVDLATLDDVLPRAGGSLKGRIHYLHDRERGFSGSRLRADLQGTGVRAFGWSVEELEISSLERPGAAGSLPGVSGIPGDAPLAVSLEARKVLSPAGAVSSISAALAGDFRRQSLALAAEFGGGRVQASLAGGATGDADGSWAGTVQRFEVIPAEGPAWSLRAAAPLRIAGQITLESACLTPGDDSSLCLDIEQRRDGGQQGRMRLESFPLHPIAQLADWPFGFSQRLDGSLSWSLEPGAKPSATAEFGISEGAIIDPVEDLELLHTREGVFRFTLDRGSLHSGKLDIPFDTGTIDIDFNLPDLLAGENGELQGRVRVELQDLDVLANFVPQLVQTDGRLRADVRVGGTARDPDIAGTFELRNGRAQVLAPGLRLSEVELTGRLDNQNRVQVEGTFLAGEGRGTLQADVDVTNPLRPAFEVRLAGESLTIVDVPDLRLQADPDLTANWSGEELRLSGRIHVPSARFAPRYLPSDTATESPDVVIVAGGEERQQPQPTQRNWKVTGEVEVSMGENVVVDLDLARATMKGKAQFRWNGPLVPVAKGRYDLKGEIQAYGQTLEITRASVRFPNVPANNPHLDIRAERRIYGNSLISHAGVLVHGTLKRPLTEPYTVPLTNADRARTLLITGSDFNYDQGVGAVNVGTYISPKLFLSYGVGLFEEGNIITARYDLGRNFGIKATSGQNDSGIDISYTIER